MNATKIIVWTNPTSPFQKIYAFVDGQLVDQMGVAFDDVETVIYEICEKYNISKIDFSGSHSYAKRIGDHLEETAKAQYSRQLEVQYI